jgi:hypothetical protein
VDVPAATIVTVEPLTVHTGVVVDANETVKPDDAVAETEKGALPYVLPESAPNVMVCDALATVKERSTLGAAAYVALPACEARIVQVPAATIVTVLPLTVQTGSVNEENETGSPEEAVAGTAKGALP